MSPNQKSISLDAKTIITITLLVIGLKWLLLGLMGIILMWIWMKWKTWVKLLVSLPIFLLSGVSFLALLTAINPAEQVKKAQLAQVDGRLVQNINRLIEAENAES